MSPYNVLYEAANYSVCTGTCYRGDVVPYSFHLNLLQLKADLAVGHISVPRKLPAPGREEIVEHFLRSTEKEYLLFLDDDQEYPMGTVQRLYNHQLPIVGGLYFSPQRPFQPVVYRYSHEAIIDDFTYHYYDPMIDEVEAWLNLRLQREHKTGQAILLPDDADSLMEADAIGTGCMMVHRDVFRQIPQPWFSYREGGTEDLFFCRKARAAGYQIWADMTVLCNHRGRNHVDFLTREEEWTPELQVL